MRGSESPQWRPTGHHPINGYMDTGRPTPIDPTEHHPDASESCLAVMYHYIRREDPIFREGVIGLTPEAFEAQLDLLCAEREPIDWPSLVAWTQGRGTDGNGALDLLAGPDVDGLIMKQVFNPFADNQTTGARRHSGLKPS